MSTWNDRNAWVYRAADAVDSFTSRGIAFPQPVLDALAVMRRVAAAKPDKPAPTLIREAIIAGADDDDIGRLLLADATHGRLLSEWSQAHTDTAGAVLAAVRDAGPELMTALAAQAAQAIDRLHKVAELGPTSLDALVRQGRHDDAELLADRDVTAADLNALYELRDRFLVRGGPAALTVNGVNCSRWRDPDAAHAHARGNTVAEQFIAGLAAGCDLWFPAPEEAIAAAQAVAELRSTAAKRQREAEHGLGSFATFST